MIAFGAGYTEIGFDVNGGISEVPINRYLYSIQQVREGVIVIDTSGNWGVISYGNTSYDSNIQLFDYLRDYIEITTEPATASTIAHFDANKVIKSLPLLTYPSLTELSYLKGVTGPIQPQFWKEITMVGGDQTTTSASGQDITELVSGTLSANTRYYFKGVIRTACNNTGGVKFAVTVPAGTTFVCFFTGRLAGSAATANMGSVATAASGTLSGQALNTFSGSAAVYVSCEFATSATTGVAQFQFASGVAGQTSTIHQDGTLLEYKEIP